MIDYAAELAKLGDTPDAVAASLLRLGCRGERKAPNCCPLAVFARRALGVYCPLVGGGTLAGKTLDFNGELTALPDACQEFVDQFDGGIYPELDLTSVPKGANDP